MKSLLACGALLLAAPAFGQSFVGSFPLVTTNGTPVGLGTNGVGELLFTDIGNAPEIGVCSTAGSVRWRSGVSPHSLNPLGIAFDGGNAYVTDTWDGDVDVYDSFGIYQRSFSVAQQTVFPEGIAYRGTSGTLFVVGATAVFEYGVDGTLRSTSPPLNGSSPDGIAWDPADDTFWVYDSGTDSLRHYDSSFQQLSAVPGTVANGLSPGEGVAVIGDRIYVCATSSDAVAIFEKTVRGEARTYGRGCPAPADFYELFADGTKDLDGRSITLTPSGGAYQVTAGGAFDSRFSNRLVPGDDLLYRNNPLGFTITVPGAGRPVNSIDIDTNGRCGFGIPATDHTESVAEFLAGHGVILAANWDDLHPAAGLGGVFFDTFRDRALVTWSQVPQYGFSDSNTFQVQIYRTGVIVMSWVSLHGDGLVGFSTGVGHPDPGPLDLTASLPYFGTTGRPLTLDATSRPVIGQPLTTVTANVPRTAVLASLLVFFGRVEITAPIFLPSCTVYATGNLDAFPIDQVTGAAGFPMPNAPVLVGQTIYAQSVIADASIPTLAPVYLSNGLELRIGDS